MISVSPRKASTVSSKVRPSGRGRAVASMATTSEPAAMQARAWRSVGVM